MDEFIDKIADEINEHVNLPWLNEEQERLVIRAIIRILLSGFAKKKVETE